MSYEYLDDVGIADIAFRARGSSLEQLFIAAAEATLNVMVEDPATVEPRRRVDFELANDELDMLLFDFLQELIYHKDAAQLLLRVESVQIDESGGQWQLAATARGEQLDPSRHEQWVDVKAVTLHRFSLEKTEEGWTALVLLDI